MEALFYQKLEGQKVKCRLCNWKCTIPEGKTGICGVRQNKNGVLFSLSYGKPCSISIDPIEKKPLFHFLPGNKALSIGTLGCNFFCQGCQNFEISRTSYSEHKLKFVSPEAVINHCLAGNCRVIAFTYNEPTIFFEYMLDIAKLAKKKSIKTVIVSNGYMSQDALKELCKYIDAANIDLKGFSEKFYREYCKTRLQPVLDNIIFLKDKVWLELTNLLIPGMNDELDEIDAMCKWIKANVRNAPLHFSRFFPMYRAESKEITAINTLEKAKRIAEKYLDFVYVGNVREKNLENTVCPGCKKIVIERSGYRIGKNSIKNGKCSFCSTLVKGIWR